MATHSRAVCGRRGRGHGRRAHQRQGRSRGDDARTGDLQRTRRRRLGRARSRLRGGARRSGEPAGVTEVTMVSALHGPGQCVMVLFGASGDLAKRLLVPALYNLACDGLLPKRFALVGVAMDELTTEQFRERMSRDIRRFSTRRQFNEDVWRDLEARLYYPAGRFDDATTFTRLASIVATVDAEHEL